MGTPPYHEMKTAWRYPLSAYIHDNMKGQRKSSIVAISENACKAVERWEPHVYTVVVSAFKSYEIAKT